MYETENAAWGWCDKVFPSFQCLFLSGTKIKSPYFGNENKNPILRRMILELSGQEY